MSSQSDHERAEQAVPPVRSSESAHTPGPWEADNNEGYSIWRIVGTRNDGRHSLLAEVIGDCAETDANARLIAAAPDMLAVLREIEGTPASMVNDAESLRHTIKAIQHIARTAIARAEGRS